jgi:hypothetical protein
MPLTMPRTQAYRRLARDRVDCVVTARRTARMGSIVAMTLTCAVPARAQQPAPDPSPSVRLAPDPAPVRTTARPSAPAAAATRPPAQWTPAGTSAAPSRTAVRSSTRRRAAPPAHRRARRATPAHRAGASPALVAALRRPPPLPHVVAAPASPRGDRALLTAAGAALLALALAGAAVLRRAQLEVRT